MSGDRKNIIFDVGMVLIDFCWEKACRKLGFSEEIIADFEKNMIQSKHWERLDEGTITEEDAVARFKEAMPTYADEIDQFWAAPELFVEEYSYAAPLIRELKEKGHSVYLLSNYPLHMYEIHWPTFTFFSLVDGYVVSSVEKVSKPDEAIYRLLCERYALEPEECLFIDDRPVNVEAARSVGMKGILFKSESQLRRDMGL